MGADLRDVYRRERLLTLDVLRAPVWIFDLDHAWEADPLERRSVEALRHVGEPVSWYTPQGAVLLRNPAAMRAFGEPEAVPKDSDALGQSFVVPGEAGLARAAMDGGVRRFDARLRTSEGERMHSVEARRTLDPITGQEALLVCSRDVEDRVVYQQRLEAQAEELGRLAAPVLRVGSGVLVLPLIGRVDGARMEVALAAVLPRIASDRARAVIFDLTGATFVDAETAESLRRGLGTLRLLGCVAVVAGVLPGLARLLVEADARLGARAYQTVEEALRGLSRA